MSSPAQPRRLTKRTVDDLRAESVRYEVFDDLVRGPLMSIGTSSGSRQSFSLRSDCF